MPYPRRENYDKRTHQATTIYLNRGIHALLGQEARELSVIEGKRVSQSDVIERALFVYFAHVDKAARASRLGASPAPQAGPGPGQQEGPAPH